MAAFATVRSKPCVPAGAEHERGGGAAGTGARPPLRPDAPRPHHPLHHRAHCRGAPLSSQCSGHLALLPLGLRSTANLLSTRKEKGR